jgi:hypothetical protein
MQSEQPPFSNVALMAEQMDHHIGFIGDPDVESPRISPAAYIQPQGDGSWAILENGEVRATYPNRALRASVVWKAEARDSESRTDNLTLDRVMAIFTSDLRHRNVDFQLPSDSVGRHRVDSSAAADLC